MIAQLSNWLVAQTETGEAESQATGSLMSNSSSWLLLGIALTILAGLLLIGKLLSRQSESEINPVIVRTFNRRIASWMSICVVLALALVFPRSLTVFLFFVLSFWAMREFITITSTRRADHRTLFWVFVIFTPLQYILIALMTIQHPRSGMVYRIFEYEIPQAAHLAFSKITSYDVFTILIPVYATLFIAARIAFTGDRKRYFERIAKIQFAILICVYALSHAPALLYLKLGQRSSVFSLEPDVPWPGDPKGLLVFLVILVQFSDLMHFLFDKLLGKHVIAPNINSTRSWEGLICAAIITAVAGMIVQVTLEITPFNFYGAALMAFLISVMGTSGSMTMSAIKRDRGIQDHGTLVTGHASILDRIDSICFAAPIFFHVTRFFLQITP